MNNKNENNAISLIGISQIIFIILKLTNQISWSWLYVFIPTLICIGFFATIFVLALIMTIIDIINKKGN